MHAQAIPQSTSPQSAAAIKSNQGLNTENSRKLLANIEIPPQPTIVQALMRERVSESPDIDLIVKLIMQDAALSAAVLKTINSPYYGLRNKIGSISQSVSILGLKNIGTLVMGLVLRKTVKVEGVEQFWEDARRNAQLAALLARRLLISTDPEQIQMYGLFHDAAVPVLMQHIPSYRQTFESIAVTPWTDITAMETSRHKINHSIVGGALANDWGLPDNIVTAIKLHHEGDIFDNADFSPDVLNLIALGHIAEGVDATIAREQNDNEWETFGELCLNHLGMDTVDLGEFTDAAKDLLGTPAY